jgi:signal peptidase
MTTGLRVAARTVNVVWLAATIALFTMIALPYLLPAIGRQMYIVRGASMQPAIPIGAVVVVDRVDPATIQANDVITFRSPTGTVVTHRVVSVVDAGDLEFMTKGDANDASDPVVVPATSVIGRVEQAIPGMGGLITNIASVAGSLAALGVLLSLLLTGWFIEELARTLGLTSAQRPAVRSVR